MKVALLGNMNNNNFSIMRYLRDLGVDAHLLLMKDDITKSQVHFEPDFDTWVMEKWRPYIHYLGFVSYHAALFYPGFVLKKYFSDYDMFICSGVAPVILNKCGIKTDIFYPYGIGIEGVGDPETRGGRKDKSFYKRLVFQYLRKQKISAIKKSRLCLTSELSLTRKTFLELGVSFRKISIPMVYNKESIADNVPSQLQLLKITISRFRYKFFCHVSHVPYKTNQPMLEGFAKYIHSTSSSDCVLILLEYGTTVQKTKAIIKELGVEHKVKWIPKMPRKEIMYLLESVDFGFSEFEGIKWGGTGWEFLSKGVPFFHYFDICPEQFLKEYGVPIPPFINTTSADEICTHLINYTIDAEPYKQRGRAMVEWFEKHGGLGLAEQWKEMLTEVYKEKKK